MKFDNEVDYMEWITTTHGVIKAFEHRGYALYLISQGDSVPFITLELLRDVISFGPTEDVLDINMRYIPLPLVDPSQRSNPDAVMAAAYQMAERGRGPFFVDLQTNSDGSVSPIGRYLVDSVYVEPPHLYLVIDSRFGGTKGSIELHLGIAADTICKQLTLALRKEVQPKNILQ